MYQKLKNTRIKKNYSSKYMAKQLNISSPYYSQIENGRRKLTYEMAIKIAKIFNTKPDKLFYEDHINRVD